MNSQFQPCFKVICAVSSVIYFVAILMFSSLAYGAGVSPIALLLGRLAIASIGLSDGRSPSLGEVAVIRVLQAGNSVQFIGRMAPGAGVIWVEAIAPDLPPTQLVGLLPVFSGDNPLS